MYTKALDGHFLYLFDSCGSLRQLDDLRPLGLELEKDTKKK